MDRYAQQMGGGDHADESLLGPSAALQQPVREVAAATELGEMASTTVPARCPTRVSGSRCGGWPSCP